MKINWKRKLYQEKYYMNNKLSNEEMEELSEEDVRALAREHGITVQ